MINFYKLFSKFRPFRYQIRETLNLGAHLIFFTNYVYFLFVQKTNLNQNSKEKCLPSIIYYNENMVLMTLFRSLYWALFSIIELYLEFLFKAKCISIEYLVVHKIGPYVHPSFILSLIITKIVICNFELLYNNNNMIVFITKYKKILNKRFKTIFVKYFRNFFSSSTKLENIGALSPIFQLFPIISILD